MERITITDRDDVLAVVARMLGFQPQESLVVITIGGGPTARVDLASPAVLAESLAPMLRHIHTGVLVVTYTANPGSTLGLLDQLDLILPGVQVYDAFEASHQAGPTREDLVQQADEIDDPDEAEALAWQAYESGDGASAWIYLDRANALRGFESGEAALLAVLLAGAVRPPRD